MQLLNSGIPSIIANIAALMRHVFGCQGFKKYKKVVVVDGPQSLQKRLGSISPNTSISGVLVRSLQKSIGGKAKPVAKAAIVGDGYSKYCFCRSGT